ncbi:MAG TPA: glycerol-3-phosphate 1-O-acyltransferase PlsY [Sphingobium sp.]|nr:glycerol-3-phosphate 1-O-acyltransferase PlsY [Sphingobium sp.]
MMIWQTPAIVMLLGYLIGSIPFGVVVMRLAGAGDLRKIGSGNIGATNVLRTGRKGLAAATLLLDLAKGAFAVALGGSLLGVEALVNGGAIAGVTAFIGHCYPVWLRFDGGKGVATMMGVVLALAWPLGLIFAAIWLGMLAITRISSAGGITAALSAPLTCLATGRLDLFAPCAAMTLIVLWRHRANISRLMAGDEPRIGEAKA